MNFTPKVSVVMTVFNTPEKFLKKSIESILNQTIKEIKLIIVDDCSNAETKKTLKEFEKKDKRIKLIENKKNLGTYSSANLGIKQAKSQFIARMDSDDISSPQRLKKQLNFLENNKDFFLCSSEIKIINEQGKAVRPFGIPTTQSRFWFFVNFYSMLHNYLGAHGQIMFRKKDFEEIGEYNTKRYSMDMDLFSRAALTKKMFILPEALYYYRINNSGITATKRKEQKENELNATKKSLENAGIYINQVNGKNFAETINNFCSMETTQKDAKKLSIKEIIFIVKKINKFKDFFWNKTIAKQEATIINKALLNFSINLRLIRIVLKKYLF